MYIEVDGKRVETDEQGFLLCPEDWSEEFVEKTTELEGLTRYDETWGLIDYFRVYHAKRSRHPWMHQLVLTLGHQHGGRFRDRKEYEKFLYKLFPRDPIRALCKLAGLPKPESDT